LFNDQEKAVILFADKITRASTTMCDGDLEGLRNYFSEEQIVEIALTVCVANFTNRFNETFLCEPDLG
jgi:alkylhydroperoxidase family enzyme